MSTQRPWLASYPPGVPAAIDVDAYRSLAHVLESACERFYHRPAFANMGRVLSYADIDRLSRHFASYLLNVAGLKKGDRVAIMLPNVLQYPIAIFGVLRAGLTVVNTNPMYTARELRHQLQDAGASAIVVLDNFASTLAEVLHDTPVAHVITTGLGDLLGFPKSAVVNLVLRHVKKMVPPYSIPHAVRFNKALAAGARKPPPKVEIGHGDIAFLQYTGGTTGVAKGAMLTHGNMVANMQQSSAWLGASAREGEEVIVTAIPLYHIFA
ncbi:MAG TPA: AMP-binding protein, partial [Rudaea sp.]|nr:AMP-binding protein [Rudaea sp.]